MVCTQPVMEAHSPQGPCFVTGLYIVMDHAIFHCNLNMVYETEASLKVISFLRYLGLSAGSPCHHVGVERYFDLDPLC